MTERQRNLAEWVAIGITLLITLIGFVSSSAKVEVRANDNKEKIEKVEERVNCMEEKTDEKFDEIQKQTTEILVALERIETKLESK